MERQPVFLWTLAASALLSLLSNVGVGGAQQRSTMASAILRDIQRWNATCHPKDTCKMDKVSSNIFILNDFSLILYYTHLHAP